MEKRPLVSVIIPAYNCAGLISRAIESVLIQEVSLEIFVIDDGSGDNLEQVLELLTGQVTSEDMVELTYAVDVDGRAVAEVAHECLVEKGCLES